MPYVEVNTRKKLVNNEIDMFQPGHLNFKLTMLCKEYLEFNKESYKTYNDIIGALECCKLEIYRRKIADYENKAIERNTDVY